MSKWPRYGNNAFEQALQDSDASIFLKWLQRCRDNGFSLFAKNHQMVYDAYVAELVLAATEVLENK